jgi:hypothetical protein
MDGESLDAMRAHRQDRVARAPFRAAHDWNVE